MCIQFNYQLKSHWKCDQVCCFVIFAFGYSSSNGRGTFPAKPGCTVFIPKLLILRITSLAKSLWSLSQSSSNGPAHLKMLPILFLSVKKYLMMGLLLVQLNELPRKKSRSGKITFHIHFI